LRTRAAIGSALFFLIAPGTTAGLVPWLLTGWEADAAWLPMQLVGGVLVAGGLAFVVQAFVRFVAEGVGTPAPTAPTEHLVVGGVYRYVRNPMYVALIAVIAGQGLLLGQPVLLGYAFGFWLVTATFVRLYEEPTLARRYGEEYATYRRAVPGWLPRLRPWTGGRG
jgi:protein-S-isoprenylcysteine O-methyltransferase Ste14